MTTGFTAGQEVSFDLVITPDRSRSPTPATARRSTWSGTITTANHLRAGASLSVMSTGDSRMSTTTALVAGTQTLDPNPVVFVSGFAATTTAGLVISRNLAGNLPSRHAVGGSQRRRSPLVLAGSEGFVIRNVVLQGAAGIGNLRVFVGWDEGVT